MSRKTYKSQKSRQKLIAVDLIDANELAQEDKANIEQAVSANIKYLDSVLEEQLESILFENNELKLTDEKREEAILFAKQIYFQG